MVPLDDEAQVEARFSLFDIVLILMQDRCTVCVEHTIGLDIILDAPDGTLRRRGSCAILFWSIQRRCYRRCKIGARFEPNVPYGHKIVLDAPDGILGFVGHVESCFGPFGDSVSVGAR